MTQVVKLGVMQMVRPTRFFTVWLVSLQLVVAPVFAQQPPRAAQPKPKTIMQKLADAQSPPELTLADLTSLRAETEDLLQAKLAQDRAAGWDYFDQDKKPITALELSALMVKNHAVFFAVSPYARDVRSRIGYRIEFANTEVQSSLSLRPYDPSLKKQILDGKKIVFSHKEDAAAANKLKFERSLRSLEWEMKKKKDQIFASDWSDLLVPNAHAGWHSVGMTLRQAAAWFMVGAVVSAIISGGMKIWGAKGSKGPKIAIIVAGVALVAYWGVKLLGDIMVDDELLAKYMQYKKSDRFPDDR